MNTPILKTTAATLAFAVSLALGSAALANEERDKAQDQDTTSQRAEQAEQDSTALQTDPVDTMDASTLDTPPTGTTAMDDMDEPSYDSTAQAEATDDADAMAATGVSADLRPFSTYDANGDGFVERSELAGDNSIVNDAFVRFDSDNDGRLDNYEFDTLSSADFATLDADGDGSLDPTESSAFAALGTDFASADTDGDGMISKHEHKTFVDSGAWSSDRERYAFQYLDRDGDGYVSRTEAAAFDALESQFDSLDQDGDGLVDNTQYDGFLNEWDEDEYVYEAEGQ